MSLIVLRGKHPLHEGLLYEVQDPVKVTYGSKDIGLGGVEDITGSMVTGRREEEEKGGSQVIGLKEVPGGNGSTVTGDNLYIFLINT